MSTFRGVVQEFPDIRIDFFRLIPGMRPPRKCFLSHVHSDHLAGLETPSFHSCFIYCSAATREILLRLEKYPQRLNFQKGILEKPPKVTYKHLDKLLKTIPLETPTCIELEPGNDIQVTLFDANHCTGAVMFLIEANNKAILYTGDIRSEPWFVNNLTRNPFLIGYTCGLKTLDRIYLDTSNTTDIPFPPKADGLKELLQKVSKYPADTVFHFSAWTFGYEEVWMALSQALKSQIHVDDYKVRLYASLRGKLHDPQGPNNDAYLSDPFLAHEGPALTGYKCGNAPQAGCLTSDTNVRLHSCEKGLHCGKLDDKTVWIRPIVTRTRHGEMAEVGVGGGGGDLAQRIQIELDSEGLIDQFLGLFADSEDLMKMDIKRMLSDGLRSRRTALSLDGMTFDPKQENVSLKEIAEGLARSIAEKKSAAPCDTPALVVHEMQLEALPRILTFPYSRHSSYEELCHLVKVFNPRDVYPCTVDEMNWDEDVSMERLFGSYISPTTFRHDNEMRALLEERNLKSNTQQTQTTAATEASSQVLPPSSPLHEDRKDTWNWGTLEHISSNSRHPKARISGTASGIDPNSKSDADVCYGVQHKASASQGLIHGPPENPVMPRSGSPVQRTAQIVRPHSPQSDFWGHRPWHEYSPAARQPQKEKAKTISVAESSKEVQKDIDEMILAIPSTPPDIINALSPGSASQTLRRKAIHERLEGQVKRARLSYDGPVSSPSAADSSATPQKAQHLSTVIEISDESDGEAASTPGSEDESPVQPISNLAEEIDDPFSTIQPSDTEQSVGDRYRRLFNIASKSYDNGDLRAFLDSEVDIEDTINDTDRTVRCRDCGHEMWTVWMTYVGFCTGDCGVSCWNEEGLHENPYYEIIDPELGPRPAIDLGHYADYMNLDRENTVGDYIDNHSDAYDTFDEEEDHQSHYDSDDSFIDNASVKDSPDEQNGNSPSAEREDVVDYKAMFQELQRKHERLLNTHEGMIQDFVDSDYAYGSSSSEESYLSADADIEEIDEYGAVIADVKPPDPQVVELVLSQAQEQSQESEVSRERILDRAKAFEAAAGDEWNSISLVSTGDNHTHAEIEL
ncbi:DNA cross-link repair 1C [Hyphodiscus hymeniophilus]|uniref:Protein artemis n=1 Tax=Hyphodiscus hymeniophilus TaxID=353542 RepID=A0A9P6VQA0_9HELO|nr:DNA cross-link repair 1C [Hyphodiscus hymeniophilus]